MNPGNASVAPDVTVVMSCYNVARWAGAAIESILRQTCRDFEFIIVDDGSADNTLAVIKGFADRDARIRIVAKPHTGVSDSRNIGIAHARGRWIAILDADDEACPERLEKQVDYMQKHPEVDILGAGVELICSDADAHYTAVPPEEHDQIVKNVFKKTFFFHSTVMMKKTFLEEVGGYDRTCRRCQDLELWIRGIRRGYTYHNLQEVLGKYRTNDYRQTWKTIGYYFIASVYISLRHKYFIKGLTASLIELVKNVLVRFRLYRPASIRRRGADG